MTKVREDENGLYVIAGGYTARPGNVDGYDHAYRMDGGELKEGDTVKARHLSQSQLTKLTLPSGQMLYWHHDPVERTFDYQPNRYNLKGLRIYD